MSGGLGSRTTAPKYDVILAALDLGLQAWRTTASRDRFIDAGAELGHARVAYDKEHAARVRAEEALRRIEALQPKALAYIEANGFVFDDIGNEPGNWKHLAFSLYSDLCEANQIAAAVVPEETP